MDTNEILRRNPQVDPKQAEAYRRYVAELERAGIWVRPQYRLDQVLLQPHPDAVSQEIKRR